MAVDNVVFNEKLAPGFKGGPRFDTTVSRMVNEQERRLKNRSIAIHEYTYQFHNRTRSEVLEMKAFFMDRSGRFRTWLLRDYGDFEAADEVIGSGDGVETDFQLRKTYTAGFAPYVRPIRHIKAGTVTIEVGGVPQPSGWSISSTGLVTFTAAPVIGSITWSGEFYVPVRFDTDSFPITVEFQHQMDTLSVDDLTAIEVVP